MRLSLTRTRIRIRWAAAEINGAKLSPATDTILIIFSKSTIHFHFTGILPGGCCPSSSLVPDQCFSHEEVDGVLAWVSCELSGCAAAPLPSLMPLARSSLRLSTNRNTSGWWKRPRKREREREKEEQEEGKWSSCNALHWWGNPIRPFNQSAWPNEQEFTTRHAGGQHVTASEQTCTEVLLSELHWHCNRLTS